MELARDTEDAVEPWCRAIADTVRDVIYCTRTDGTLEYVNAAFERLTGWSADEWIGRSFLGLVHPDDRSMALERLMRLRQGEELPAGELRWLRRDGSHFFGEHVSAHRLDAGRPVGIVGILRDVTERRRVSESPMEAELRRRDGSSIWVLGGGSTVLDADGNTLIQATLIDVTRRRVLEERQRQVEKMEAIGGSPAGSRTTSTTF